MKQTIILVGSGGTANKLIQIAGAQTAFPNKNLVFVDFQDVLKIFDVGDDLQIVRGYFFNFFLRAIFKIFAKTKMFGTVKERPQQSGEVKLIFECGFLKSFFIAHVFLQDSKYLSEPQIPFKLKESATIGAQRELKNRGIFNHEGDLVFVHIRRKDYLFFPSKNYPAVLPYEWFSDCIDELRAELSDPIFLIFSDDSEYLKNINFPRDCIPFYHSSIALDFALMSLCKHGILSASTFSWCGAVLARSRSHTKWQTFFAPKYWIGHRMKKWYPNGFKFEWVTYR